MTLYFQCFHTDQVSVGLDNRAIVHRQANSFATTSLRCHEQLQGSHMYPRLAVYCGLKFILSSCSLMKQDLSFTKRTFENGEEIRKVYLVHALNHVLK